MKIRVTRSVIPNLFTIMNMFCGFLSVINAAQGNYLYASTLIIIASIFDALDGLAARITKSASEFGVELDSLSDIISFGIAPSILIYKIKLFEFQEVGILISAFYLIMAGLRLARFNVQLVGFEKTHFNGLPAPLGAITVSSFILTFYDAVLNKFIDNFGNIFIVLVISIGFLTISKIKYDAFPKPTREGLKEKSLLAVFIVVSVFIAILSNGKAIIFMILTFIIYGFIRSVFKSTSEFIKANFPTQKAN